MTYYSRRFALQVIWKEFCWHHHSSFSVLLPAPAALHETTPLDATSLTVQFAALPADSIMFPWLSLFCFFCHFVRMVISMLQAQESHLSTHTYLNVSLHVPYLGASIGLHASNYHHMVGPVYGRTVSDFNDVGSDEDDFSESENGRNLHL